MGVNVKTSSLPLPICLGLVEGHPWTRLYCYNRRERKAERRGYLVLEVYRNASNQAASF